MFGTICLFFPPFSLFFICKLFLCLLPLLFASSLWVNLSFSSIFVITFSQPGCCPALWPPPAKHYNPAETAWQRQKMCVFLSQAYLLKGPISKLLPFTNRFFFSNSILKDRKNRFLNSIWIWSRKVKRKAAIKTGFFQTQFEFKRQKEESENRFLSSIWIWDKVKRKAARKTGFFKLNFNLKGRKRKQRKKPVLNYGAKIQIISFMYVHCSHPLLCSSTVRTTDAIVGTL